MDQQVGEATAAEAAGARVVARRDEVVAAVLDALPDMTPDITPDMPHGTPRSAAPGTAGALGDHVRHVLTGLAVALVTEDRTVLVETRDWLADTLAARGAAPGVLAAVWAATGRALDADPLARAYLAGTAPAHRAGPRAWGEVTA